MVRLRKLVTIALVVAVPAGCGGAPRSSAPSGTGAARDRWGITWLCRPGERDNPCVSDLTTTVVGPRGERHVRLLRAAASPPVDCFYVYPTVSSEQRVNANLAVDFRLREVAVAQAARFSQVCRLYAPVYRQITLTALEHPARLTLADALIAYDSVLRAFHIYLAHYNNGRGIVLIGHSQGAAILDRLIARGVDRVASVRRRLVSALLLGGNVTNRDFTHIPTCASFRQTSCVVAYSSFATRPSTRSQFGRTTSDAGVRLLARKPSPGARIVCVNPASPAGGIAGIEPALPSLVLAFLTGQGMPSVSTPWASFPGRYTARCASSGNATWLQIASTSKRVKPAPARLEDPVLGLHILDVNIALDDLVRLVDSEAAAYARR
jgi:DUF3089 family protein